MATIAELIRQQERLLSVSDTPVLDCELLLCHCLQKDRTYLRTWPDRDVELACCDQFERLLSRREQGEPVAYLTGARGFWTLDLAVGPATLIPRPETELLVEWALDTFSELKGARILDLGTGTGAIALALAAERPDWQLLASDYEREAVALAERNRQQYHLDNVRVIESDWFAAIEKQSFHAIISNPPYIAHDDPHLNEGDVRFEPKTALVADQQGLAAIEKIADQAGQYLVVEGYLAFEHGFEQGEAVRNILTTKGFECPQTIKDLAGLDRVTLAVWPAKGWGEK